MINTPWIFEQLDYSRRRVSIRSKSPSGIRDRVYIYHGIAIRFTKPIYNLISLLFLLSNRSLYAYLKRKIYEVETKRYSFERISRNDRIRIYVLSFMYEEKGGSIDRIKFCRNFDRIRKYDGVSVRQESLLDWFSFELDLTKFLGLRVKIQSSRCKVYIPELFVSEKVIKAGFHVASCVAKQRRKGMEARYSVYPSSFRTWLIAVTKGDKNVSLFRNFLFRFYIISYLRLPTISSHIITYIITCQIMPSKGREEGRFIVAHPFDFPSNKNRARPYLLD